MLPLDCWNMIFNHLSRDDVIAAMELDSGCIVPDARVFARMQHGGVPVCISCAHDCVLKALQLPGPRHQLFIESCNDPTGTLTDVLDILYDDDDETYLFVWIFKDLVTLTARKVLDSLPPIEYDDQNPCIFCANVERITSTPAWRKLVKKYLRIAAKTLAQLYRKSEEADKKSGYTNILYMSERYECDPCICQRCGKFDCSGDKTCQWYFGEENVNKQLALIAKEEWKKETLLKIKPCKCKHDQNNMIKHGFGPCTCSSCKNTYGRFVPDCKKCSKCCIDIECKSHFRFTNVSFYNPRFCKIIESHI